MIQIRKHLQNNYFSILGILLITLFMFLTYATTNGFNYLGIHTTKESIVYDEVAHIASGYQYDHDMRMVLNPEHPILIKTLVGIPLNNMNINPSKYSFNDLISTKDDKQWDYGAQLIFRNNPSKTDQIILVSRITMLFINSVLLITVFLLSWKLFNKKIALIFLSLLVFNPNVIAHASFVTFDVPALLTSLLAILTFFGLLKNNNLKWAAISGLSAGIAATTKYSSVLLVVLLVIFYLMYASIKLKDTSIKYMLKILSMYTSMVVLFIIGLYLPFTYGITSAQEYYQIHNIWLGHLNLFSKPLIDTLNNLSGPTKALSTWINGVFITNLEVGVNRPGVFLLGHLYDTGHLVQYFPIVFLAKNTIGQLLIFFTAIFLFVRTKFKDNIKNINEEFILLIYALIYFSLAIYSKLKLGIRHLLPFEGVLSLFSAVIITNNWNKKILNLSIYKIFYILIAISIFNTVSAYPHYLSYYNEFSGGNMNGYKISVDSNYDWGQDFITLNNWRLKHPEVQLYFDVYATDGINSYLFGDNPNLYVEWDNNNLPKGSFIAVDANRISPVEATKHIKYQDIFKEKPIRLTPSIFIFQK